MFNRKKKVWRKNVDIRQLLQHISTTEKNISGEEEDSAGNPETEYFEFIASEIEA